jgi:hypothetical protein
VSVLVPTEEVEDPDGQTGLVDRLVKAGVDFRLDRQVHGLRPGAVVVARSGAIGSLDEEELTGVGAVVLAGDRRPLSGLAWFAREEALAGEVYTIGDCDRPRNALEAIAEGATVGRTV